MKSYASYLYKGGTSMKSELSLIAILALQRLDDAVTDYEVDMDVMNTAIYSDLLHRNNYIQTYLKSNVNIEDMLKLTFIQEKDFDFLKIRNEKDALDEIDIYACEIISSIVTLHTKYSFDILKNEDECVFIVSKLYNMYKFKIHKMNLDIKTNHYEEWYKFKESGLLWMVNNILHMFGLAIHVNCDTDKHKIYNVTIKRVAFRGFPQRSNDIGYANVTKYLKENIDSLMSDIDDDLK